MNWSDERYVKLYTRDTADWLALSFDAQALLTLLIRKFDRAGVLELGRHGARAVAIAIGHPQHWQRLQPALDELLADGCMFISEDGTKLVLKNYIEAQEAIASDKARQRESRERRRSGVSRNVTESHAASRGVTSRHSVPCRADPSFSDTREKAPDARARGSFSLEHEHGLASGSSEAVASAGDPAVEEAGVFLEWFNRSQRQSYPMRDHFLEAVRALLSAGHTQGEMRLVTRHLRSHWRGNAEVLQNLRPKLVVENAKGEFHDRLDQARACTEHAEFVKQQQEDDAEAAAGGGIVVWKRWAAEAQLRSVP